MGTQDLQSLPKNEFHGAHKITNSLLKRLIQCNVVNENLIPDIQSKNILILNYYTATQP